MPKAAFTADEVVLEAASTADEVVPEAASKADEVVPKATSTADEVVAEATSMADEVVAETTSTADEVMSGRGCARGRSTAYEVVSEAGPRRTRLCPRSRPRRTKSGPGKESQEDDATLSILFVVISSDVGAVPARNRFHV